MHSKQLKNFVTRSSHHKPAPHRCTFISFPQHSFSLMAKFKTVLKPGYLALQFHVHAQT